MDKTKIVTNQPASAGDAAVSGLFNGLIAGIAMGFYLVFAGLVDGQGITGYPAYFGLGKTQSPLAAIPTLHFILAHLVFGLALGFLQKP